jgi:hypothetical protein
MVGTRAAPGRADHLVGRLLRCYNPVESHGPLKWVTPTSFVVGSIRNVVWPGGRRQGRSDGQSVGRREESYEIRVPVRDHAAQQRKGRPEGDGHRGHRGCPRPGLQAQLRDAGYGLHGPHRPRVGRGPDLPPPARRRPARGGAPGRGPDPRSDYPRGGQEDRTPSLARRSRPT